MKILITYFLICTSALLTQGLYLIIILTIWLFSLNGCHDRIIYRSHEKSLSKELNGSIVHYNSIFYSFEMFFSKADLIEESNKIPNKNSKKKEYSTLVKYLNNHKNFTDTINIISAFKTDTSFITDKNNVIKDTSIIFLPDTSLGLNAIDCAIAMEDISFRLIKKGKAIITDKNNNPLEFLVITKFNNQHGGGEYITTPDGIRIGRKTKWVK